MRVKNKYDDLVSRWDRGVGKTSGISSILSRLFVGILIDKKMTGQKWNYLIGEYAKKEVSHLDNRRDMASIRGNLNKEFTRTHMTWKVFCKAMMFLRVRSFRVAVIITDQDGTITEHSTPEINALTAFEKPPAVEMETIQEHFINPYKENQQSPAE